MHTIAIISIDNIKKTNAYKKAPEFIKTNIVKKDNRILLETGLIHYNLTGEFLENIGNRNIQILNEIIQSIKKQSDDNSN